MFCCPSVPLPLLMQCASKLTFSSLYLQPYSSTLLHSRMNEQKFVSPIKCILTKQVNQMSPKYTKVGILQVVLFQWSPWTCFVYMFVCLMLGIFFDLFLPYFFDTGSLIEPGPHWLRWTGWLASLKGSPSMCPQWQGYRHTLPRSASVWALESDSTQLFLLSGKYFIDWVILP